MAVRVKGKVVWFNREKGYGFIRSAEGGKDIFVHFSGIEGDGYRYLEKDQLVEFELGAGEKGPKAVRVQRVEQAEA